MRRLRISGLVKFAKQVRQELAGPVSAERLAQLRYEIDDCTGAIEQLARDKGVRVQSLPLPSCKAYQFLKGLDLSTVATDESSSASSFPPDSVSFPGLQRHFDNLLDRLAQAVQASGRRRPALARRHRDSTAAPEEQGQDGLATQGRDALATSEMHRPLEEVYETIVSDSASIEEEIRAHNIRPEQIKKPVREMRGWLAYFSRRENFEQYCAAVRRAEPAFRAASIWSAETSFRMLVHFQPMHGMYHVVGYSGWALVELPTPAICFDEDLLRSVARIAFKKGGDRKAVHDAAGSEAYRRIDSAIEQLGGVVTQTRGLHHDLAESFERVNAEYFGGAMSRPRLVWSRSFAARKYGHYDHAHDTIMVNAVLDKGTVPEFTIDLIVYHELLHRQLGITWKNNRIAAHTPELAEKERRFKHHEQAWAVLRKLRSER